MNFYVEISNYFQTSLCHDVAMTFGIVIVTVLLMSFPYKRPAAVGVEI